MAASHPPFPFLLLILMSLFVISYPQPLFLPQAEQEAVYNVLESINPSVSWRSMFPDDLCLSAPHGIACDYFSENGAGFDSVHITELSFGVVSDYNQNPPCFANSTLNTLLFTSFTYLRKLFFYRCFSKTLVTLPDALQGDFGTNLEELVVIENKALVGPLSGIIGNFKKLRRLVLSGNGFYGSIPEKVKDFLWLEEITLSRNRLSGGVTISTLNTLRKLKILDLSHNFFDGNAPESLGNLTGLLKLDLSFNGFSGKIPESIGELKRLEFLDLSYNRFGNSGVPLFLGRMKMLKEVYLSGNTLGGQIPEIWRDLAGVLVIRFSNMGLVGNIPASMGVYLGNVSYLGLDNNRLEGEVPEEIVRMLEFAGEINLENNNLSGSVKFHESFRGKIGKKLKLGGNPNLCVDKETGALRGVKKCSRGQNSYSAPLGAGFSSSSSARALLSFSRSHVFLGILVFLGAVFID